MYIHQKKEWPNFTWSLEYVLPLLSNIRYLQGKLLGQMQQVGFDLQLEAELEILALDILQSNAIEGNVIDAEEANCYLSLLLFAPFIW